MFAKGKPFLSLTLGLAGQHARRCPGKEISKSLVIDTSLRGGTCVDALCGGDDSITFLSSEVAGAPVVFNGNDGNDFFNTVDGQVDSLYGGSDVADKDSTSSVKHTTSSIEFLL